MFRQLISASKQIQHAVRVPTHVARGLASVSDSNATAAVATSGAAAKSDKPSDEEIVTSFGKVVRIGQTASASKLFTAEQVRQFAQLSGDTNPLHTDEAYAKNTRFGRCIVHGVLVNGVLSAVMGAELPGPGSIYLSQEINFKGPLYVDSAVTAEVKVRHIDLKRAIVTFDTLCKDDAGKTVMVGSAKVMIENPIRK